MTNSPQSEYDVIINGGGIVGATLACLLAESGFKVAIVDKLPSPHAPVISSKGYDARVFAINHYSESALRHANVWPEIVKQRVYPYQRMQVWDSVGQGEISFNANDVGMMNLGHIIENNIIHFALWQRMQQLNNVDCYNDFSLASYQNTTEGVKVWFDSNESIKRELSKQKSDKTIVFKGRLLVGADGGQSAVREQAKLAWHSCAFHQNGTFV